MADAKLEIVLSAQDKASGVLKQLNSNLGGLADVGKKAALGVAVAGAGIAAGLAGAAKTAADFEKRMSAVSAVSGATGAEMQQLSALALRLGQQTAFSASQAAEGLEELVKGGLTIPQIMNGAAEATLNLAAAGGVDLASAAEIAANALNTFSLGGEHMAKVSDLIAGAANASAIGVSDFRLSLAASGAVAATVGLSFDDLAVGIAAMGNAGIKGSDAGTSLKTMLLNLQPVTKEQNALFRELGLVTADGTNKFFDAQGSMRSLADVSGVLQDALGGMTDQQRLAALEVIFGSDAIRAAAVFTKLGADGFENLAEKMGRVTAESVAAQRLDNLAGDIEQLGGAAETAAIKLGQALQPGLRSAAQAATALVNNGITPLIEEIGPGLGDALSRAAASIAGFGTELRDKAGRAIVDFARTVSIELRDINGPVDGLGIIFNRAKFEVEGFAVAAKDRAAGALATLEQAIISAGSTFAPTAARMGTSGEAIGKALEGTTGAAQSLQFLLEGNFSAAARTAKQSLDDFGASAGLARKAVDELRTATEAAFLAQFGQAIDHVKQGLDDFATAAQTADAALAPFRGNVQGAGQDANTSRGFVLGFTDEVNRLAAGFAALGKAYGMVVQAFSEIGAAADRAGGAVAGLKNQIAAVAATGPITLDRMAAQGAQAVRGYVQGLQQGTAASRDAGAALGNATVQGTSNALITRSPSRAMFEQGEWATEGLELGLLAGIPKVAAAARTVGDEVLDSMGGLVQSLDSLADQSMTRFAEIGARAGDAINQAISSADREIQDTLGRSARSVEEAYANIDLDRAIRGRRGAFAESQDTAARERARSREDAEDQRRLHRDLQRAKTDEERVEILKRAQEARDDLLHRRKLEDEDREFRKQQEAARQAFEDGLAEEALRRQVERITRERDERIDAINKALDEKRRKVEEDAERERTALLKSYEQRVADLKNAFVQKLPEALGPAETLINAFLDRIAQKTAEVAAGLGGLATGAGGGDGGGETAGARLAAAGAAFIGGAKSHMGLDAAGNSYVIDKPYDQMTEEEKDAANAFAHSMQFDHGGVVPGPRGAPQRAIVHGGETILPTHKAGALAGMAVYVTVQGSVLTERDLVDAVHEGLLAKQRSNGGLGW